MFRSEAYGAASHDLLTHETSKAATQALLLHDDNEVASQNLLLPEDDGTKLPSLFPTSQPPQTWQIRPFTAIASHLSALTFQF